MMSRENKKDTVLNIVEDESKKGLLNGFQNGNKEGGSESGSRRRKKEKKPEEATSDASKGEASFKKKKGTSWKGFFHKMGKVWPFMWPRGNVWLQLRVIICMAILVLQRFVNIAAPILYKLIVESLTPSTSVTTTQSIDQSKNDSVIESSRDQVTVGTVAPTTTTLQIDNTVTFCWQLICLHMLVKLFQGTRNGYFNILRSFLWIRVAQYTQKKMRLKLFSHLHHLSMRWHLQRKTGEVIRVMDRGVISITMILNQTLFNILPAIFDIIVAIVFFVTLFNVWIGLIVFTTMILYLLCTVFMTEWRVKFRRTMNEADNKKNAASVDSILNFETVKYYSAEAWETGKYEETIDVHQAQEWWVSASLNILNLMQKTLMVLGLLGGSLLCAWYVYMGEFTVGDYVMFGAYVEQLYGPLNMFGAYYRMLQQAFVDMENMFEMLEETQEVVDVTDAPPITVNQGEIKFDDVSFSYNENRPVLRNLSFRVPPGQTYALVGHSGGGKSSIIRLLFRFYDVTKGKITIDGQDISQVSQKSLRKQIGVVPQDTVLFNQDIRYNIRYGRVTASDAEVEEAAIAANIHDTILAFPGAYESKVGERGLKVSGGEKQRIAIARTILKAPEIVLLDEATSALDTKTERYIQQSLKALCEDKTTLIVAHRLSTIIHAHQILVIDQGIIAESGTHEELLRKPNGFYREMWREQLENKEDSGDTALSCPCCETDSSSSDSPPNTECTCQCHQQETILKELINCDESTHKAEENAFSLKAPNDTSCECENEAAPLISKARSNQENIGGIKRDAEVDSNRPSFVRQSSVPSHVFSGNGQNNGMRENLSHGTPPSRHRNKHFAHATPPLRHRSHTHGTNPVTLQFSEMSGFISPDSPQIYRTLSAPFNQLQTCPSEKCWRKQFAQELEDRQKKREAEREEANKVHSKGPNMDLVASMETLPQDDENEVGLELESGLASTDSKTTGNTHALKLTVHSNSSEIV